MKKTLIMLGLLAPFCLMAMNSDVLSTWSWDTANNTVTFSGSTTQTSGAGTGFDIAKFSSSIANSQEGTSGLNYTLTAIVVTIQGSITDGYFTFNNTASSAATVKASLIVDQYGIVSNGKTLVTVEPNQSIVRKNINVPANSTGWGNATDTGFPNTSLDADTVRLESDLNSFVGDSGTYPISISYEQTVSVTSVPGISVGAHVNLNTSYMIQYIYTVPEPTTAAMAFAGLILLGIRRRRV